MKRSEILDIIEDRIAYFHYEHDDSYIRAEKILEDLEKAGMLPPNNNKKRAIKESSVPCVINAMKCHEWEPEDD